MNTCAYHYWPAPTTSMPPTFQDLVTWHDGCCAFCGKRVTALIVDHDHKTGVVRGLLCGGCNIREASLTTSGASEWVAYRTNPPAMSLGLSIRYKGGIESYRARTYAPRDTLDGPLLPLAEIAAEYHRDRDERDASRLILHDAIRAAAGTMSELQIAKVTGVQRETVRKALGK